MPVSLAVKHFDGDSIAASSSTEAPASADEARSDGAESTSTAPPGDALAPAKKERQPPSHSADAQQLRRARKRYRQDTCGQWIKGREAHDGSWLPEIGAQSFESLEEAIVHERRKLHLRRGCWSNLRSSMATTKAAVAIEGVETRQLLMSESLSTRRHVTETARALEAKLAEDFKQLLESSKPPTGQVAFFSRLMAGFRAVELRALLTEHGIEPVGTKQTFAELVVEHLTQEQVSAFLASRGRCSKRQRLAAQSDCGGEGRQSTLDALITRAA